MFTVKICRMSGDELIMEAREVSKEERGLLLQTELETILFGEGGFVQSPGMGSAGENPPGSYSATAYVMNRFGATVATYRL